MELNPYYLDRLLNHRVQEAVQEERERICSLIEQDEYIYDVERQYLVGLIKGENDD